jgi:hypothetical protein
LRCPKKNTSFWLSLENGRSPLPLRPCCCAAVRQGHHSAGHRAVYGGLHNVAAGQLKRLLRLRLRVQLPQEWDADCSSRCRQDRGCPYFHTFQHQQRVDCGQSRSQRRVLWPQVDDVRARVHRGGICGRGGPSDAKLTPHPQRGWKITQFFFSLCGTQADCGRAEAGRTSTPTWPTHGASFLPTAQYWTRPSAPSGSIGKT